MGFAFAFILFCPVEGCVVGLLSLGKLLPNISLELKSSLIVFPERQRNDSKTRVFFFFLVIIVFILCAWVFCLCISVFHMCDCCLSHHEGAEDQTLGPLEEAANA